MTKGIIILALGHPYYGKMAAALAASIRCMNETVSITLLTNAEALGHIDEGEKRLFNSIEQLNPDYYTTSSGQFSPLKARVYLDKLSPYDRTLSLDADNLWIQGNDPEKVIDDLAGKTFTVANAGYTITDENADPDMCQWGEIQTVIQAYGIQHRKYYKIYAEWFYFERNPISRQFFLTARNVFNEPPKCATIKFIGQPITEELAFCIAMARHSLYPHKEPYFPTFWYYREPDKSGAMPYELKNDYFAYSLGGNRTPDWHVNIYNNLAAYAYQKLGLRNPYRWKNKRDFIPEREKI